MAKKKPSTKTSKKSTNASTAPANANTNAYQLYNPFLGGGGYGSGSMFVNPSNIPNYAANFMPSYSANNNLPTSGGPTTTGGTPILGNKTIGMLSGDPFGILSGIFGSKDSFQPYVNENGQYVYTNPNSRNPVPVATVPGAPLTPSNEYKQTAGNIQAITDLYPYYNQAINSQLLPSEIAKYNATAATSPAYAELMTNMYNTYGSQLNDIGNEIARRNAMAQAGTDLSVIRGPGRELVQEALQTAQMYDPEYFATRAQTAGRVGDLLSSIDLSGGLSQTERDEIAKGLAREGAQRGTQYSPSQSNTVANAMRYGQAGYNRQQTAKSNLATAIQAASQFLPTAKSGVDVFQVATGKSSMPNAGNSQFTGLNKTDTSQGAQLGNQMFSGMNSLTLQKNDIEANKKDWLDKFNQFTSGLSNIGSMAGGALGI